MLLSASSQTGVLMSDKLHDALETSSRDWPAWLERLSAFIAFPSISGVKSRPEGIQGAAGWLVEALQAMGLKNVAALSTGGNPVVYGEDLGAGSSAPTVLIYGHYDVVEVEPAGEWTLDPFKAEMRGDELFGRGSTDMKGQIIASLAAVDAVRAGGTAPVNFKFLLEGEEEYPPRHLEAFLEEQRDRLASDICLNPDAGMVAPDTPTIVYGLRGNMRSVLTVRGPRRALHSGLFGGLVHNPIQALCELIAVLHTPEGRVAIPGFYDNVRPLDPDERALLAQLPVDEAFYRQAAGVPALWGEAGFTPLERLGARPAVVVTQFDSEREKVVIPTQATADITFRMVPYQEPERIFQLFQAFVAKKLPPTVSWDLTYRGAYPPVFTQRNSPAIRALTRAFQATWGREPLFNLEGGGIPAAAWIESILGIPSLLTGFASPEDGLHGPDEHVHLPTLKRGVETLIHFFFELAAEPA
jgi:acetylornithine deacetylase/succinyl-diaminopimelate desuccinylase-like protein